MQDIDYTTWSFTVNEARAERNKSFSGAARTGGRAKAGNEAAIVGGILSNAIKQEAIRRIRYRERRIVVDAQRLIGDTCPGWKVGNIQPATATGHYRNRRCATGGSP